MKRGRERASGLGRLGGGLGSEEAPGAGGCRALQREGFRVWSGGARAGRT